MTKFFLPEVALPMHTAVLGKTGSGKTSTAKLIVEHVVAHDARVCILDPIKSDWWGITSRADGERAGLPFYILGGPHGHVPLHESSGKAIAEIVANGALPLSILDMSEFNPGGQQKFFVDFAPMLMRRMSGVVYVVIEEAHLFAPKERSGFGAENMAIHWAKTLATAGRSKGIRLLVLSQRTQALHNAVLGSCDTLIAHRFTAPADRDPIIKWLSANVAASRAREVSETLSALKTGEAWICAPEADLFERRQLPQIKTFDNTKTPDGKDTKAVIKTSAVDADKLRGIIGDAVKEAESNDPKFLKAEIARLTAAAIKGGRETTTAELAVAVKEAEQRGYTRGEVAGMRRILGNMKKADGYVTRAISQMQEAKNHLGTIVTDPPAPEVGNARGNLVAALDDALSQQVHGSGSPARKPSPEAPAARAPAAPSNLPAAQQKILDTIALLNSMAISMPSKPQLALWCDVSPTSGGYFNNLSKLRSLGLIDYHAGQQVTLSDTGRAAAREPASMSAEQMHDALYQRVGASKAAILRELIRIYPDAIEKDALADRLNVSKTSGGYFNNLGSLRTLGIIEYPKPGHAVAREILFN